MIRRLAVLAVILAVVAAVAFNLPLWALGICCVVAVAGWVVFVFDSHDPAEVDW